MPSFGEAFTTQRTLSDGNSDIVIRDIRRLSVISKVVPSAQNNIEATVKQTFANIVSLTKPFGIRKDVVNSPEKYRAFHLSEEPYDGCLTIHGVKGIKGGARRIVGYVDNTIVTKNSQFVKKHKLFFTTSYSANALVPPEIIIADANVICTQTFLVVGPFNTKSEQLNCHKFMQTSFFRVLLYFGRGTMQVSQEVFRFVPIQDFTKNSDIDWSKTVAEIDHLLYAKYKLTSEEIQFIESTIKPMG